MITWIWLNLQLNKPAGFQTLCFQPRKRRTQTKKEKKKTKKKNMKAFQIKAPCPAAAHGAVVACRVVDSDRTYFLAGKQHYPHLQSHCQLSWTSTVRRRSGSSNRGTHILCICPSLSAPIPAMPDDGRGCRRGGWLVNE